MSQLSEAQEAIRKEGSTKVMVGSLDVRALYPSMDQDNSAEVVAQMVEETGVGFSSVNYHCVQTFVASNLTEEEVKSRGLTGLVPDRLSSMGHRPGSTTPELSAKIPKVACLPPQELSKWKPTDPDKDLDEAQQRHLLAQANHVYQFCGVKYRQTAGGPIGLCLTSLVAHIVMDRWVVQFIFKLDKAGCKLWAVMKYVDDVNLVMDILNNNLS